ncbi:MAG TPA: hypothetical protein VIV11_20890 [Kofleriaceae bacterium]
MILPDIVLDLPDGWAWTQLDRSPLTMEPENHDGALQFSSPPAAASWRGSDPQVILAELLKRAATTFGEVGEMRTGDVPYGHFAQAECRHDTYADVCVWLLIPETHDPLFVTWIANECTDAGAVARTVLERVRPGLFSVSVRMAVEGARQNLAESGAVEPITLLVADGNLTNVVLPFDDEALIVQALRYEREQMKAEVIAQIKLGEARGPGIEAQPIASIYIESANRRKHFVMPLDSGAAHEVDKPPPIAGLFEPVDPELVPMFEAARR